MQNFYDNLTPEEQIYFDHYKCNDPYLDSKMFATDLNAMLRNGSLPDEWQHTTAILDEIISKNELPNELTVYRVTAVEILDQFKNGKEINYPAYLSTGENYECVQNHYNTLDPGQTPALIKIICPEGTHIAPFESAKTSETEREMLLGRDRSLTIEDEKIVTDRTIMEQLMGRDMAESYEELHLFTARLNN